MSASNRRHTKALAAVSRAPAPLVLRCAHACVNGVAGVLQGIQSEIANGLASHHLSNHTYRFVLTERNAILVERSRPEEDIAQADQANVQPSSEPR